MKIYKHHIVPVHAGGTDIPQNIIRVNLAMHAFLHRCLWEQYGCWQDKLAAEALSGHLGKEEINLQKMREGARTAGKLSKGRKLPPVSDAARTKLCIARRGKQPNLGKTFSVEWRAKMSNASKGKPKSESHRANIRAARLRAGKEQSCPQ